MAKLKYINFEHIGLVIFETTVGHDTMRQLVGHKAESAGFCQFPYDPEDPDTAPCCFGESVSLQLKATDEDTATLLRRLNPYGF
jgi:hypothetical protein